MDGGGERKGDEPQTRALRQEQALCSWSSMEAKPR